MIGADWCAAMHISSRSHAKALVKGMQGCLHSLGNTAQTLRPNPVTVSNWTSRRGGLRELKAQLNRAGAAQSPPIHAANPYQFESFTDDALKIDPKANKSELEGHGLRELRGAEFKAWKGTRTDAGSLFGNSTEGHPRPAVVTSHSRRWEGWTLVSTPWSWPGRDTGTGL